MAGGSLLRLVTVDITNTIIKVRGSPGLQYALIGRRHGVDVQEELLTGVFLKFYKQYSEKYPNFGATVGMPAKVWWSNVVKDTFQSLDGGSNLKEATLESIVKDLYFHFTTQEAWEFLPGAYDAIKDLRQYPVKLGVISNWDHRLYEVLRTHNLRQFFDFVLPSYVIGVEKPDPAIFHQALGDASCKPEEAVHLGDNIQRDFIGARNVGMHAYLLATKGVKHDFLDQDFVVSSVKEFVDAVRPRLGDICEREGGIR